MASRSSAVGVERDIISDVKVVCWCVQGFD